MKFILAIDPSLTSTGYCVMSEHETIHEVWKITSTSKSTVNERITKILKTLSDFVDSYEITEIAMEDGFIGKNRKGSMDLAKLRGAIIGHFSLQDCTIYEKEPSEVRKDLGLGGNASKEEVANHILFLYPELLEILGPYSDKQNKKKTSDMYDAVSIALSHLTKQKQE